MTKRAFALVLAFPLLLINALGQGNPQQNSKQYHFEYLWYEAENMQGFSRNELNEPVLNPSYQFLPRAKAPGWGINGPGVSAEWSQGGESEWNSAAASADETKASIHQDVRIPVGGNYKFFVRYADWAGQNENFVVRITQGGRDVFRHEFGVKDIVDPHDEVSMYWGWAFAWDSAAANLSPGPATVFIDVEKAAEARRHVDCWLLTNDPGYTPDGRKKPPFAASRMLEQNSYASSLLPETSTGQTKPVWKSPAIAGREFLMPWNIAKDYWSLYEKPESDRPIRPFNAEDVTEFVKTYKGKTDVPIFGSKLVVPVVYINELPGLMKEGSSFLRYLRATHAPFAVLINYGSAGFSEADGGPAWKLLSGEFKGQFIGWISGESIGYVWPPSPPGSLTLTAEMPREEILEKLHQFYTTAIAKKWQTMFHIETGAQWDKLIVAQSTSSTSFAHPLSEWGSRIVGMETAAVQPGTGMRIAFTRGATRQYGGAFLYYHAANFGDTALSFSRQQNFGGPDFFYHSHYGQTMGTSLTWYRKCYYLYYMSGASAIYNEQGFDQFFKPGPGEHPFQLNPVGRITDEFVQFAERHPDRGVPVTPIAFLLDPAHGWDMTDYPQWPYGVSPINRSDRSLRELMGVAYFPMLENEGEPATSDRQAFISGKFGDTFDVLVTSNTHPTAINNYRAVVAGGHISITADWVKHLTDYVRAGGVVLLNAAQVAGAPEALTGITLSGKSAEDSDARCLIPGEQNVDLSGQKFSYEKVAVSKDATVLMQTPAGDPLVTSHTIGKGRVIVDLVPDMLGLDERMTPFSAHLLSHVFTDSTPVHVRGDVEYLINQNENGWVVTLLNNRGVYKPQQGLAEVNRSEFADVVVSAAPGTFRRATEWTTGGNVDIKNEPGQNQFSTRIPAGGIRIFELVR